MMNFGLPLPEGWYPISRYGGGRPTFTHLITAAASVRLSHYFRRSMANNDLLTLLLLPTSFKDPNKKSYRLKEFNFVQWANEFLSEAKCPSCLYFFNEEHIGKENRETTRSSFPETSNKDSFHRRRWTNILLTANVLLFILQIATKGKLMVWGAKVNSLIDKGQFWRLVTPSFLHANIGHLMVNCYSLHSVGPTVESICGPRRFIAVYFTSGVASTAMSYWLSQANSVGASGAIFGLVGSVAVFLVRHRGVIGSSTKDLQYIARVLFLNMMLGLMSRGIDNWGHVGGLLGGAAASWFLGPAWQYNKSTIKDGRRVFIDKAPMYSLLRLRKP